MFRRLWNYIKALFNRTMDRLEDPEILLDQARREMRENLASNRERAIQAITQKNNLQHLVDDHTRRIAALQANAEQALRQGNRDLARQLLREKAHLEQTLEGLKASLAQATETVEAIKVAMRRQEEQVKAKYAEMLALKARWKQAQITKEINKAMESLTFETTEQDWSVAAEKIRHAESEAAARQEMMASSLQGKMLQLEDQTMDAVAEKELQELEQRMGLAGPAPTTQQIPSSVQDVEAELAELEQRLGSQPPAQQD
ncbi:MAG: PspA/IM30 family protein [Fimbriimonadia bacterium]|jgi:phage shock protein A